MLYGSGWDDPGVAKFGVVAGSGGDVLISVQGVSKKFYGSLERSLWYGVQDIASEMVGRDEFWTLRDISFELRRGECIELNGRVAGFVK